MSTIEKLKTELKAKEQEFEEIEKAFGKIINKIRRRLMAFHVKLKYKYKNDIYYDTVHKGPYRLPEKATISFMKHADNSLIIEFESGVWTLIRICCSGGSEWDDGGTVQEIDYESPYFDHFAKRINPESDERDHYIAALGYSDRFFILKCLPEDWKTKYKARFKQYQEKRKEIKKHKEWISNMTCSMKLEKKFGGDKDAKS